MKMKQVSTNNRVWSWIVAGALCLTTVSASLTSCQLVKGTDDANENVSSVQKDAYDAKILYYESQVQSLTAQLGEMEQQFYVLRDEYMDQLKNLEQQLRLNHMFCWFPLSPLFFIHRVLPFTVFSSLIHVCVAGL